jgi:hypothetical protein
MMWVPLTDTLFSSKLYCFSLQHPSMGSETFDDLGISAMLPNAAGLPLPKVHWRT